MCSSSTMISSSDDSAETSEAGTARGGTVDTGDGVRGGSTMAGAARRPERVRTSTVSVRERVRREDEDGALRRFLSRRERKLSALRVSYVEAPTVEVPSVEVPNVDVPTVEVPSVDGVPTVVERPRIGMRTGPPCRMA